MSERSPGRVVVAGDWHGDAGWAQLVIGEAAKLLADQQWRPILHLGDFGIWPGSRYLERVSDALDHAGAVLWFIDGNHEDFPLLERLRGDAPGAAAVDARGLIWHLPRGHRWTWHDRTWLACGGGVSVDRSQRTEGRDWWPQEEISDDEADEIIASAAGIDVDVMVTHDCPSGVVHSYPPRPAFWDPRDLARSDMHQKRLQRIVDCLEPAYLMHGHLHAGYQRVSDFGYGPVQVTGLDRDGARWNYAVLDTRTMEWEAP